MSISPKLALYINIVIALLAALVSGTVSFGGLVPDPVNHAIVTWAALALSIFGVVNAALHSVSAPTDGPLTNVRIRFEKIPPKERVTTAVALAFVALLAVNYVVGTPVLAAKTEHGAVLSIKFNDKKTPHKPPVAAPPKEMTAVGENNPIYPSYAPIDAAPKPIKLGETIENFDEDDVTWDVPLKVKGKLVPQPLPVTVENNVSEKVAALPRESGIISSVWKQLQAITLTDLEYANNLAINNQDTIASSCYSALITLIQKSQNANVDPTTGQPMPVPNVHLVTDLENILIIYRELQPTSATSIACAPLMNAVKVGSISALLSGFGTGSLVSSLALP